ncbi:ankyrin-3-like isoform X2 [Mya arenaria]|uniref:ankyrin-3-like isoform X2 n=1 Tax=Mya arenaria TaxID=6604 RepID=UPI0022E2E8A5|nr:ankyrin-3-like isoform X2 [Mya arenaria]
MKKSWKKPVGSDAFFAAKLKKALNDQDTVTFNRIVKGGINLNGRYWFDSTLLHEAVQTGQVHMVQTLLQNGAEANCQNKDLRTPLHLASRGGNKKMVELLLNHAANPNAQSMDRQTPLHCATWKKKHDVVVMLIEHGADVNLFDKDGWLPIHWASKLQTIEILLSNGSIVDAPYGKNPRTPFLSALLARKKKEAILFLEHGASNEGKVCLPKVIMEDKHFRSVDQLAAVKSLFHCGLQCSDYELNLIAANMANEDIKRQLLQNCANIDLSLKGKCRSIIRSHLKFCNQGRSILKSVHSLPLPALLKSYVSFVPKDVFVKSNLCSKT